MFVSSRLRPWLDRRSRGCAAGCAPTTRASERKEPLTTARIVDAAMALMAEQGYDAVSMRSLARALNTGPASLYAHVANRDDLDQLVIDRIASLLQVPAPDPERWDDQLKDLMRQMLRPLPRAPRLGPRRDGGDPHDGGEHAQRRGDDGDRPGRRHLAPGDGLVHRPRLGVRRGDRRRRGGLGPADELHRRPARSRPPRHRRAASATSSPPWTPARFPLVTRFAQR